MGLTRIEENLKQISQPPITLPELPGSNPPNLKTFIRVNYIQPVSPLIPRWKPIHFGHSDGKNDFVFL